MALDYAKDSRINETALELEWLDQADLAIRYGKEWAALRKKVTILEENLKVVRSKLINKAWNDQTLCAGGKANMQTVEAFYRNHKKHIKAKEELIEAQHELDLAEIAKNEVSFTRKAALENLVKLHAADYFAGPNVPRNISKLRKERDEERKDAMESIKKIKRNKE